MAKGKPTRRRRRRGRRPLAPAAGASPVRPVAPQVAVAMPGAAQRAPEPSITRFSSRDYSYVRRELRRIALLAGAIIVLIVVLSFFLP